MRAMPSVTVLVSLLFVALPSIAADDDFAVYEKGAGLPDSSPDRASVFIVRPATLGTAVRLWAFADEIPLGVTHGNTWTHAELEPGTYRFWAKGENVSAVDYTVEAGKTYYMKLKVKMGGMKARVRVEFLPDDEGKLALGKCEKFSTLTAAGQRRATEIVAEKHEKAKEKPGH